MVNGGTYLHMNVHYPIVFLSRPSARLEVIEGANVAAPVELARLQLPSMYISSTRIEADHLAKLAILDHHSVNDSQEALIARKDTRSTGESISLHHPYATLVHRANAIQSVPTLASVL